MTKISLSDLNDIKEDSFQTLEADLAFLKEMFGDQVDHNLTLGQYIDFDIELSTKHGDQSINSCRSKKGCRRRL